MFSSPKTRAELARQIEVVRGGLPHITDFITAVCRKGTQLQSRCESVKTEVSEAVEKHVRDLRARERALHEDIDSFFSREIRGKFFVFIVIILLLLLRSSLC